MKANIKYLVAFIILLVVEIIIALFIRDAFIRPFVGDVLVVCLLYCFIRMFTPKKVFLLPLYVFLFATAIEFTQYFNLVQLLHLENNTAAKNILGTTFDIADIICYFIGCVLLMGWQILESRLKTKNSGESDISE